MTNKDIRDIIAEHNDMAIVFDNPSFDNSIIGIDDDGRVIYSFDMMVKELSEEDGISEEDAIDFIDYNTIRSLPYAGEFAPIICYKLEV